MACKSFWIQTTTTVTSIPSPNISLHLAKTTKLNPPIKLITDIPKDAIPHLFVVQQWEEGDPSHGMTVPLKLMTLAERSKNHKLISLYGDRKMVVDCFYKLGKIQFESKYKEFMRPRCYTKLRDQIRKDEKKSTPVTPDTINNFFNK